MQFDEGNLLPLYKLTIGKPGSSYTFSIAERIGLDARLINRARALVDEDHFRLDKLLNRTEQDLREIEKKEAALQKLIRDNEKLQKEMQQVIKKELHEQQVELLKQQNRITEDRIAYLKDMERKLKQLVFDWKKTELEEDKKELIRQMHALLFKQHQKQATEKVKKKINSKYDEVGGEVQVGDKVLMKKNHQVGEVKELRGKKAVVQLGLMPITVSVDDLVVVTEKPTEE
jgi:DNA mismatch repair protein MutS2